MRADYRVVLDACVLIPMPLADTLLRMAEEPRLYMPLWSQTIMDEVTRNLIAKWDIAPEQARRREEELRRHFAEAWVEGYEPLVGAMTNDPGETSSDLHGRVHPMVASMPFTLMTPHSQHR